ncbi:hypothetical protein B7P43_G13595 [Cryptotermes secundus]|nr:hypothetical protein B7P43_G13595 [Cryptotermes secundus]
MDVTLAVEKQVKLEDIERDYLRAKQAQKQQQQQQQQQVKPQQPARDPEYTGNQQLNYPVHQQLQAYQPQVQFQAPPTAGAVALYLTNNGLHGDYLGIVPHVAYISPQHQSIPIEPQQFYLHPGGYSGFQFVRAPPTPLIYSNPPATALGPPKVVHSSTQKEVPTLPSEANTPPQHDLRVSQLAYQQQPPAAASAVYTLQQGYNPIPKELQSYTTIPAAVYQGKEPDFLYDQQPSVSLTNDGINSYNALQQQQSKPQRPVFSSGVKSNGSVSLKALTSGGSFLFPTRHFPSPGISYRQGPGPF